LNKKSQVHAKSPKGGEIVQQIGKPLGKTLKKDTKNVTTLTSSLRLSVECKDP
jgi:hypothetical protein